MLTRRAFTAGVGAAGLGAAASRARASDKVVKIGVLTDMSGALSSVLGTGSVDGARMAIEDFGASVAGMPVQLVFADHQLKPDIASTVARRWMDEEGVDLILDLGSSSAALAVQSVVASKNKIIIVTGAATSDITGKSCTRNSFHWGYDTYMQSAAVAAELTRRGGDTWFFIVVDYAYGHTLEADARGKILQSGGRVLGSVRHPPDAQDLSSFLLQAQGSGAKMIGIGSAGDFMDRVIRQGAEFGVWGKQTAVAFGLQLYNIPAIGVKNMQGIVHNSIFYWDTNDQTRAFSKRFRDRNGKPPAETHAVNYSAVTSYLKAVRAAGTKDTEAVLKALRELPVQDAVTPNGQVRQDGRLIRPTYLTEVKKPADVKAEWDCLNVIGEIPADQAFKPLNESACPLVKS
ncbi:MAG: transporter permease [Enterovirga sp.]|jgi:branched-chain amino acid transport system substrate-binding protein|nr:transporter permease [Enterovirga sp.]